MKKYQEIEKKVLENRPLIRDFIVRIGESKYSDSIEEVEEIYYTHPEGLYTKGKNELKKDVRFHSIALIENRKHVKFYGHAIQRAIEDTYELGGGKVVLIGSASAENPNIYYSGALNLKSGVELYIEQNAVLRFIRNKSNEYYPLVFSRWEGVDLINFSPMIYAYEAKNIKISGKGVIDGGADEYNWMPWKYGYFHEKNQKIERDKLFKQCKDDVKPYLRIYNDKVSTFRPCLIQPYLCSEIEISDVKIVNSPFWEINPVLCENVYIHDVYIASKLYNNDGVDPECCKDVIIERCYFLTGDDCIAIKSGRNDDGRSIGIPSENIIIRNNEFKDGHGGITIGSEISGGVKNIYAHDNLFDSPELDYPIRFKNNAERGGIIEDIYIYNSTIRKSKISIVHADFYYEEGTNGKYKPVLRNVYIDNVKSQNNVDSEAKYAIFLRGFSDSPIENIYLKNFDIYGIEQISFVENSNNIFFEEIYIDSNKIDKL